MNKEGKMKRLIGIILAIALLSNFSLSAGNAQGDAEVSKGPAPVIKSGVEHITLNKDNTLNINDVFYGNVTGKLAQKAKTLDARLPSGDPLYLVINSPGGDIDAGLEMIEILSNLNRPVHTINIFSASMGFQAAQGLGERLVTQNGTLMSHKARGGFYGEFPGQLDSRYEYYKRRIARMDAKAVERSNGKLTAKSYADLIENEYWCDGQDCVDRGVADRVVTAACDKSLEGTNSVILTEYIDQGYVVQITGDYDVCPVNSQQLSFQIYLNGKPLFVRDFAKSTTTMDKASKNVKDPLFGDLLSFTDKTEQSVASQLSAEQLFEINQRAQAFIREHTERRVVKGY